MVTTWAQTWLAQVTKRPAWGPIIYTTPTFWSTLMADSDWFAKNGYSALWIALWTAASQSSVRAAN